MADRGEPDGDAGQGMLCVRMDEWMLCIAEQGLADRGGSGANVTLDAW